MNRKNLTLEQRIERVNQIQKEAVTAWAKAGGVGTVEIATGIGKMLIGIKCIYVALKQGWIQKGDTIRFWAETNAREKTIFEDELKAALKYMGPQYNFVNDFNCIFRCYQSGLDSRKVAFEFYDEFSSLPI